MKTKRKPRSQRRKRVTATVTVSVPGWLPTTDARREIRTLINDQANYRWDIDNSDIRAISVKGVKA